YATAGELADDLRRFLGDLPVRARRPSPLERAARWARRHRTVVTAAVAALVFAVGVLACTTCVVMRQRDEARQRRRQAREAVDTMFSDVAEQWLADQPHLEPVQQKFLLRALQSYE